MSDKSLNSTPVSTRTHIGFFGRMNVGKSSLINALAGQPASIVSDHAGTTTDVVKKTMEIHGIGPCVLLDTAGFDDSGDLGTLRTAASRDAADSTDLAVIVCSDGADFSTEKAWLDHFKLSNTPVLIVLNGADLHSPVENDSLAEIIHSETGISPLIVSAKTGVGLEDLRLALIRLANRERDVRYITGGLVEKGDLVILVMPQDPQAPEGRLIVPEVQTIRELLDRHCISLCVQPEELPSAIHALKSPPKLIVTDSQAFGEVYRQKPEGTKLTSFSVLFAAYKGDIHYYANSVQTIEHLSEDSRVLIAECCTHAPMDEDIGRVKIPALLRKRVGPGLQVDVTAGKDFPDNLADYDLVIQCGGCMFNRKYICSRIDRAKAAGVPMTNYGITIAYLKGILDKVSIGPESEELS